MIGKNVLPLSLAILSFAMPAFADQNNNCCPTPCTPVCCPPIVEDCCSFTECPPANQVTPNAGPRVKNGWNFYGTSAFTFWTAHEDGLAFALIEDDADLATETIPKSPTTTIAIPDFHWRPGFKVGAGMDFCHDGWDVFLDYTWFHSSHNTKSISVSEFVSPDVTDAYWLVNQPYFIEILAAGPLPPPFVPGPYPVFGFYEQAFANWGVRLNVFDLELARNFYVSRRLTLRPYFGLKGMWGLQKYVVEFNDVRSGAIDFNSIMVNKSKNWGIGIRTGFDTAWHFTNSFSLLGEFALTGLWEQFKVHRIDRSNFFAPNPLGIVGDTAILINHQYNFYNLKPVIEWFLGFRWETWTCEQRYHFALDAGWEQQIWFGQNQFLRVDALDADHGDLGLQGLTARFRFDF